VGLRTAEAVIAFMDDPHRFSNSKKVGAYFGLVPSQDQSGSKNKLGHITREGSPEVRHLLTETDWQGVRRSATIKAYFERIHREDKERKKIAIVATAHYLVRVMWSMLKNGTEWQETIVAEEKEEKQKEEVENKNACEVSSPELHQQRQLPGSPSSAPAVHRQHSTSDARLAPTKANPCRKN